MHKEDTVYYIYLITNNINSKVYVGQTKNPKNRKGQHWFEGKKPNSKNHLYRSMHEYGIENFQFEIIEKCSITNVDDRERYWISYYQSCNPTVGYNRETGGTVGKVKILSEADKVRIYRNPKRSEAISKSLTGRSLSEEHKAAVSASLTQYFETHEVRHTEESRRNMSDAQKIIGARKTAAATVDPSHPDAQPKTCPHCGNSYFPKSLLSHWVKRHVVKKFCSRKCVMLYNNANISEETRQKISEAKSGSQLTEEHKRKISESMKQYRRNKS